MDSLLKADRTRNPNKPNKENASIVIKLVKEVKVHELLIGLQSTNNFDADANIDNLVGRKPYHI